MEVIPKYFIFLIILTAQMGLSEITLESPPKTTFGKWGKEERCPIGTFAAAFQLKTEQRKLFGDNTALNSIRLSCHKLSDTDSKREIKSTEGLRGKWGVKFRCNEGFFTGFQLRSEDNQGPVLDDSAANNLRMFCSSTKNNYTEGDGLAGGQWTNEQHCFERQAICGIQTQVEDDGSNDLTGLNNVRMICCDIPNPAKTCIPKDDWVEVIQCDNRESGSELQCKYTQTIGVGDSSSSSTTESNSFNTLSNLGFDIGNMIQGLQLNFQSKLSHSANTGFEWQSANTNTWHSESTKTFEFVVPPYHKSVVSQIVGQCEQFGIHTSVIRKVDTNAEGKEIKTKLDTKTISKTE